MYTCTRSNLANTDLYFLQDVCQVGWHHEDEFQRFFSIFTPKEKLHTLLYDLPQGIIQIFKKITDGETDAGKKGDQIRSFELSAQVYWKL